MLHTLFAKYPVYSVYSIIMPVNREKEQHLDPVGFRSENRLFPVKIEQEIGKCDLSLQHEHTY